MKVSTMYLFHSLWNYLVFSGPSWKVYMYDVATMGLTGDLTQATPAADRTSLGMRNTVS